MTSTHSNSASSSQGMKVLSKDDKDASMHTHFMHLAIEQAQLSAPVPSGYCVGAVLVQEAHQDLTSTEVPVADRFKVLATGHSRELPGNTHAEECCLLKLAEVEDKESQLLLNDPLLADLEKKNKNRRPKTELIMYSTMEPCSTRLSGNKSCSERLIESGVRRVYVGVREPDHFVKQWLAWRTWSRRGSR